MLNLLTRKIKGVNVIRKNSPEHKKWLDKRSQRKLKKKRSRIKRQKILFRRRSKREISLKAPKIFSLQKDPQGAIKYFDDIIKVAKNGDFDKTIKLDIEEVEEITIDSIMYILAIISNLRTGDIYRTTYRGNSPKNETAASVFIESGFYKFVESHNFDIFRNSEKVQIITGKDADIDIVRDICDFVYDKTKKSTKPLYATIVELMNNTHRHAYDETLTNMVPKWYIYVENNQKIVNITFLDTGLGIPQTVHKAWIERLTSKFPFNTLNDARLIVSAMLGEFRSQTRQKYRGKGLPDIHDYCLANVFNSMTIVSGKGVCVYEKEEIVEKHILKHPFQGTLFTWSMSKEEVDVI